MIFVVVFARWVAHTSAHFAMYAILEDRTHGKRRPCVRHPDAKFMPGGSSHRRAATRISMLSKTLLGKPCLATANMARPICSVVRT